MKRILSLTAALALMLTVVFCAPAGAAGEVRYTSRKLKAYLFNKTDTAEMTCLFRDDLPAVPYISAMDYLSPMYTVEFSCKKNADGTYTVSNKNGEMVVDVEKDIIHFDAFQQFVDTDALPYLETETADYISEDSKCEYIGEQHAIDLDLGKYGIDLTASGSDVYFPLSAINDIFASNYHAALYLDGDLYFIDQMEEDPYYDDASLFQSITRDKSLVEYSYHELCFVMDHLYGCPPSSELAQSILDKGFDRTLEEYNATTAKAKKLLLSDSLLDYCIGLMYLDMYMDDGGHTVMSAGMNANDESVFKEELVNLFYFHTDDERIRELLTYYLEEYDFGDDEQKLEQEREDFFETLTEVKAWDDAVFYISGGTGIFSFDEFKDAVVEPFKWSLDYSAEHGIKNFVIDLSLNYGGSTSVASYMLSVMCGDPRFDISERLTGDRYYAIDTVDNNLDGEFDDKDDAVKYDLQYAVLTSRVSFSCANLTPCLLQDHGIPVLGEQSGGGTCTVTMHYDPAGYAYAISDSIRITHADGSDLDGGAVPDVPLPAKEAQYKGFYDLAAINQGIEAFYANRPAPVSPTGAPDATEATEAAEETSFLSGVSVDYDRVAATLWVIGGSVAAICAAVFVIVLISGARKKNRFY